jgi:hypothetical protein
MVQELAIAAAFCVRNSTKKDGLQLRTSALDEGERRGRGREGSSGAGSKRGP